MDPADMDLFVQVLLGIDTGNAMHISRSDLNESGAADGGDIAFFVAAMLG